MISITSFLIMGITALLCEFPFINIVGERGSEGILLAKFAPVLMKKRIKGNGNNLLFACNFVMNEKAVLETFYNTPHLVIHRELGIYRNYILHAYFNHFIQNNIVKNHCQYTVYDNQ